MHLQVLLPLMLLSPPLALPVLPLLLLPSWISNIRFWKRSARHVPQIAISRKKVFFFQDQWQRAIVHGTMWPRVRSSGGGASLRTRSSWSKIAYVL